MTRRFGIDTSILVRLLTGDPPAEFRRGAGALSHLIEVEDGVVLPSNQVIGEAYIAVQHHYGVSRADARTGVLRIMQSGLVAPQHARKILAAIEAFASPGLMDRLIAVDYTKGELEVLTLDQRMACLPDVQLL